jgi:hypothetical protein
MSNECYMHVAKKLQVDAPGRFRLPHASSFAAF